MRIQGTQVIVHLGRIPPYVSHYAAIAASALPEISTFLVADAKKVPQIRNVEVINARELLSVKVRDDIQAALSNLGIDPTWRGGYWTRIFMRFALVEAFMNRRGKNGVAIQLESDILSSLSDQLLHEILAHVGPECRMPFIDHDTAGPGLMLAASPAALARACGFAMRSLLDGDTYSDMRALANAQDAGLVRPLPSYGSQSDFAVPIRTSAGTQSARLVFDAAAAGQFLFGIDPRNNRGIVRPGYLETRGGLDPGQWENWRIVAGTDQRSRLACDMGEGPAVFANLHVHAKISIREPTEDDKYWARVLSIANGLDSPRSNLKLRALGLDSLRQWLHGN